MRHGGWQLRCQEPSSLIPALYYRDAWALAALAEVPPLDPPVLEPAPPDTQLDEATERSAMAEWIVRWTQAVAAAGGPAGPDAAPTVPPGPTLAAMAAIGAAASAYVEERRQEALDQADRDRGRGPEFEYLRRTRRRRWGRRRADPLTVTLLPVAGHFWTSVGAGHVLVSRHLRADRVACSRMLDLLAGTRPPGEAVQS